MGPDEFNAAFDQVVARGAHAVVLIGVDLHFERTVCCRQACDHFVGVLNVYIVVGCPVSDQELAFQSVCHSGELSS